MKDDISQIIILLFSGSTIFFLASESKRLRKIGFLVGIVGEPAWIYTTIVNEQWGILCLSIWYTINFVRGLLKIK